MRFAEQAAAYFESVEIVELHHPNKVDAPSGSAIATAEAVSKARRLAEVGPAPDATTMAQVGARWVVTPNLAHLGVSFHQ
jgi:4-hydroxy-tetrahydrodipicolinate reductase